jgi:uncharacterized membrane protein SirB2
MLYSTIKIIHISCVVLSISGFILRGFWMWRASTWLQHPLTRRLPHFIDSLLLASALALAYISAQYPLQQNWLTAKVLALLVYILLGMVALRWAKTRRIRIVAWMLAIMVSLYCYGCNNQASTSVFLLKVSRNVLTSL